jgi:hypothetical protein
MDLHEADKNHLQQARESALDAVKKYNWIKIDCEKN